MTTLNFSDREAFDTSGPLRVIHRKDGWYAIGKGLLCACDTREEAEEFIRDLAKRLKKDGGGQ